MANKTKFKKGFTLMEVLVAATIFAVVMVIATGIIAQGSTYGTKIKTMRETSEETRRLADMITRDVKSANSPLVRVTTAGDTVKYNFKNGIALSNCIETTCSLIRYTFLGSVPFTPTAGSTWDPGKEASAITISTKDGIKVYIDSLDNKTVHYNLFPSGAIISNKNLLDTRDNANIISSAGTETMIKFGGLCPMDDSNMSLFATLDGPSYQQSYIQFYITSRTKGFDGPPALPSTQRAQAELRGMVTGRSYNTE